MAAKSVPKQLEPYVFKPGQSGNPAGRPPGSISIIGKLKQMWADDPEDFERYVQEIRKDKSMRKPVMEQIDGKPVQPIAGVEGQPIVVNIVQYGNNNPLPVSTEKLPT